MVKAAREMKVQIKRKSLTQRKVYLGAPKIKKEHGRFSVPSQADSFSSHLVFKGNRPVTRLHIVEGEASRSNAISD